MPSSSIQQTRSIIGGGIKHPNAIGACRHRQLVVSLVVALKEELGHGSLVPVTPREHLHDVFISYAHADRAEVELIEQALLDAGLRVWRDRSQIEAFGSISLAIVDSLASSKVFLAYYSRTYPRRSACQWELTTAVLATRTEQIDGRKVEIGRRVLVVNPEPDFGHIDPPELRDSLSTPRFRATAASLRELVAAVTARARAVASPLEAIRARAAPPWYGSRGLGSNRFFGRVRELWQLHDALTRNDFTVIATQRGPAHAQLRGMGGIGKSLLAEEYALRFASVYPGGVFWLSAAGDEQKQEALELARQAQIHDFAAALGIDAPTDDLNVLSGVPTRPSPEYVEKLLATALAHRQQRYLWIVDDLPACSSEQARRRWLAPNPELGKTLITTRDRSRDRVGEVVELDVLDSESAYELVTHGRGLVVEAERDAARALVVDLGCHPLALDVASGALDALAGGESIANFRERIATPRLDVDLLAILGELGGELPNGGERNVIATLLRGYDLLDEPGRDFLQLASVLAPTTIPADLVAAVLGGNRAYPDAFVTNDAVRRGFARANAEGGGWFVHVLLARAAASREPDPERRRRLRTEAMRFLGRRLAQASAAEEYQNLSAYATHARFLVQGQLDSLEGARLLTILGVHDLHLGAYGSAQRLQERGVALAGELRGREHPDALQLASQLGWTLRARGEARASYELLERVASVQALALGQDHADTMISRYHLGYALVSLGNLAEAERVFEQVHASRTRQLGAEAPETLTATIGLAAVLRMQAHLERAEGLQRFVLESRRRRLGDNHMDTILAMNELAETARARGDLRAALSLGQHVLATWTEQRGEEHPLTLTAMSNLAFTLWELGGPERLQQARALEERVVLLRSRVLGELHEDTLRAMNNLGVTLRGLNLPGEASQLHAQTLAGRRQVLDPDHPDIFESMNNLALALVDQDERDQAKELQEQVLAGRGRALRAGHPDIIQAAWNLLLTLRALNEHAAVQDIVSEYLEPLLTRPLASLHPRELAIRNQWHSSH